MFSCNGNPRWEGVYISIQPVLINVGCSLASPHFRAPATAELPIIANAKLQHRFTSFDYSKYGILAAERLDPNMLLFSRRSDRSLDLNHPPEHSHVRTASDENMIPTSQAAVPCDTRGVSDLAEACRYLAQNPDPIDWISEPLDLEHGEGSVTSLETTSDFRAFGGSSDESMR